MYYVADCDTLSFIYLSIADSFKLPLRIMERSGTSDKDPGHNFVRWEVSEGVALDCLTGARCVDIHIFETSGGLINNRV